MTWTPKAQDDPGERQHPVTYEFEDGLGYLPVVDQGDPPPTEEHYAEAKRINMLEHQAMANRRPS